MHANRGSYEQVNVKLPHLFVLILSWAPKLEPYAFLTFMSIKLHMKLKIFEYTNHSLDILFNYFNPLKTLILAGRQSESWVVGSKSGESPKVEDT